jgi:hypothetical protein
MNNLSLLTADRATHLKIVVLSLVCATVIAALGIAGRMTENSANTGIEPTITKAAKPVTAAAGESQTIR